MKIMIMAVMLLLILVVSLGSVSTFADTKVPLPSPLKQFNQGIPTNEIQCNDNKILLESPKGKPVCVYLETSGKLLDRGYVAIIQNTAPNNTDPPAPPSSSNTAPNNTDPPAPPSSSNTAPNNTDPPAPPSSSNTAPNNTASLTTQTQASEEKLLSAKELQTITQATIDSFSLGNALTSGIKKIPNPGGDWVPILDRAAFLKKITSAMGDSVADNSVKESITEFDTEKGGSVFISDWSAGKGVKASVQYNMGTGMILEPEDELPFIDNFMNNMGYKVGGMAPSEWIENCEMNPISPSSNVPRRLLQCYLIENCEVNPNPFSSVCDMRVTYSSPDPYTRDGPTGARHSFGQSYSGISFTFYAPHQYTIGDDTRVHIYFNGWTNYPELVKAEIGKQQLDPKVALQKAYDFTRASKALNEPVPKDIRGVRTCLMVLDTSEQNKDSDILAKYYSIIAGVPYYTFYTGSCEHRPSADPPFSLHCS